MCGIGGIASLENGIGVRENVGIILDVLKHRGPDDCGIESWPGATLGHRRLSILDLSSAGHQPMLSADGNVGVVFNGAIYNFRSLRSHLESKYQFRSQTDTEVLVHGYREWGFDGLIAKIRGMFAIGLWDDREEALYLVRDRLGVKPLCYAVSDGQIGFASTVRALRQAGFGGELNENGMAEYLEFGFLTDEQCIYKGISKVEAGQIVEWRAGELRKRKYWEPPAKIDSKIKFEDAVDETERLLLKAVERRLQADVPVGALLSGGIDSSLVCWAIRELGSDVKAFTVGTPDNDFDETDRASQTARFLGIEHQILEMSSRKSLEIDELVRAYAEPFACSSALGMLGLSREVRRSATVLLTGDGGDDVFLGYPEHKHFMMAGRLANRTPQTAANFWLRLRGSIPSTGHLKRAASFIDYSTGGLAAIANARDGLPFYSRHNLLGNRLEKVSLSHRKMTWSLASGRNLLAEFLTYDRRTRFVGEYLPKVDGGTMLHALEARSPFLDTDLWEFAASLPFDVRLHKGRLKAVLREIARRRLGEPLAIAKKQGFLVPVEDWLRKEWKDQVISTLNHSLLESEGWINTRNALKFLKDSNGADRLPRQIWFILVLESWLRFERKIERVG